jgi:hypothetical protein
MRQLYRHEDLTITKDCIKFEPAMSLIMITFIGYMTISIELVSRLRSRCTKSRYFPNSTLLAVCKISRPDCMVGYFVTMPLLPFLLNTVVIQQAIAVFLTALPSLSLRRLSPSTTTFNDRLRRPQIRHRGDRTISLSGLKKIEGQRAAKRKGIVCTKMHSCS